jgi:DNA-binding ferritin-like protein
MSEVFALAREISSLEEERKRFRGIIADNNRINNDMRNAIELIEDKQHKLTKKLFEALGLSDHTDTDWL